MALRENKWRWIREEKRGHWVLAFKQTTTSVDFFFFFSFKEFLFCVCFPGACKSETLSSFRYSCELLRGAGTQL